MSPQAKKFLSAVLVAVAAAVIGVLQTYVVQLSPALVAVFAPILVGAAHYVNALGHKERVEAAAQDRAVDMMTDVINREASR
jgi:hypothetical protein